MKRTAICLAVSALTVSPLVMAAGTPSAADIDQASVQDLKKYVLALSQRIEEMEVKTDKVVATAKPVDSWADRIQWSGDVRYRYETIDDDAKAEDRNRNRIRARLNVAAKVADDVTAGVTLASGSEDPVSSNQSLGGGATSKGLNLDMAWIDWNFAQDTHLVAGKTANPFFAPGGNGLIWDGDYRPEGANLSYDNGTVYAVAAYHFLESDNKAGGQDAEEMYGAQLGFKGNISDNVAFNVGGSYFYIPVEGSASFYDSDFFGNSSVGGLYEFDYEVFELFAELSTSLAGMPATLFADYVNNSDADEDTGYALGFKLGKAKKRGAWEVGYTYEDLEADAVFATFTDSDFGGGGTDVKGHKLSAGLGISDNTSVSLTYFINEYGDFTNVQEEDYNRLQLDLQTKFK
ncbi:putative porin [Porticoccus sp.]